MKKTSYPEKLFLVKIKTLNQMKEWDYEPNTEIIIPVLTYTPSDAMEIVEEEYWGSEYPVYTIIEANECDDFLFKPIL